MVSRPCICDNVGKRWGVEVALDSFITFGKLKEQVDKNLELFGTCMTDDLLLKPTPGMYFLFKFHIDRCPFLCLIALKKNFRSIFVVGEMCIGN